MEKYFIVGWLLLLVIGFTISLLMDHITSIENNRVQLPQPLIVQQQNYKYDSMDDQEDRLEDQTYDYFDDDDKLIHG